MYGNRGTGWARSARLRARAGHVTGSAPIAHYVNDHEEFDGFVFPTKREVYLHNAEGIADKSQAVITISIDSVAVQ